MSSKSRSTWIAFALLAILAYAYSRLPWEWGIMDDGGYYNQIHQGLAEHGLFAGTITNMLELARYDLISWGLLRPSFWIYAPLIYLFPVGWAYAVRFLMFVGILWASLAVIRRAARPGDEKIAPWLALCVLLSVKSLYDGLGMVSLQETCGIFFLACAFLIFSGPRLNESRWHRGAFLLLLFLGIGFKSPLLWLLPGFAIYFAIELRRKVLAAFLAVVFFAGMASAVILSRRGGYTQQIYHFTLPNILTTTRGFAKHGALPVALICLLVLSAPGRLRSIRLDRSKWTYLGASLFMGGALYLATLLPRGVGPGLGYYFSAPLYLMALGALVLSARFRPGLGGRSAVLALALIPAITMAGYGLRSVWRRNQAILFIRDWALQSAEGERIGVNAIEVPIRLNEILKLRSPPERPWRGHFEELSANNPVSLPKVRYYAIFDDQMLPAAFRGHLVGRSGSVSLWDLSESPGVGE